MITVCQNCGYEIDTEKYFTVGICPKCGTPIIDQGIDWTWT